MATPFWTQAAYDGIVDSVHLLHSEEHEHAFHIPRL
jgi:hypothetical protein